MSDETPPAPPPPEPTPPFEREPPAMTPKQFRRIRRRIGLTRAQLARALRLGGRDPHKLVTRFEKGDARITGPLSLAMEALDSGWRPHDWRNERWDQTWSNEPNAED